MKILCQIKSYKDIVILEADKARQIVVLDKTDFDFKVTDALRELHAKRLSRDPTSSLLRKLNELKKLAELPFDLKEACNPPMYACAPLLFFKIKTHKSTLPLRPLVSKRCSPIYNLEVALLKFLTPFFPPSKFTVTSSETLISRIKNLKLSQTDKLYSLDVVSLFPSVPIKQVIEIILSQLKSFFPAKQLITIEKALNLVLFNNYFRVGNNFYLQEQGCPMGSPLSPFIAEIALTYIEENIVDFYPLAPTLYVRYVDVIFQIILMLFYSIKDISFSPSYIK
ncbi:MAG: hypothetical protein I4N51_21360 [Acinetobacter sp.]|nr:hypothetical protein [Acinetobacter sp.]